MASSTTRPMRMLPRALALLCLLGALPPPGPGASAGGPGEVVVLTARGPISPIFIQVIDRNPL